MSLFTNYTTALRAEHIKKKGTGTYLMCLIFGAFLSVAYFFVMIFSAEESSQPVNIPYNYYQNIIEQTLSPFLGFFFPLLIIIIAAKISQIDHKNGGWQLMETQPLSKLSIYLSKLSVLLIGNLIAIISFLVSFVAVMWILTFIREVPANVTTGIPFGYLFQLLIRTFVASLFLSALQLVISIIFSSFILPILIGFFALLGTQILDGFQIYRVWNPFTILSRTSKYGEGSELNYFLLYTEKIALVGFITVAVIGFIWYQNKTFRRTFFKAKSLIKVLVVLVIGVFGIGTLLKPNVYDKHNRTVIAGTITSEEAIHTAYLIDRFINDTLVEIAIKDNKFHKVVENEIPLESYYLVFKASNQFSTNLYISTNDSIYLDIQYLNNVSKISPIKGTRLVENQYSPNNVFGGWSYAQYLSNDNSYLDKPERVTNEIYKEWKNEFNTSDNFRTRDNYAPQSDFAELNKKITTLKYLTMWNTFEEKAKVINPEIINGTPQKIQEIKKHISFDDNSLVTNESYFNYLMYEITKKDTTDIDIQAKRINAIAQLENNDFKDRLLFSTLKKSLQEASDSGQRQELIKNYGSQINNQKLKSLAYSYFTTQEKLAKGNPAQDFVAQNIEGEDIRLSDFKGKYVVIDVWATWCGPCLVESPHFERIAIKNKNNKEVVFVGLSVDKRKDNWYLQAKSKSESVVQLHLSAEEQKAFEKAYDLEFIPRFIFIDKEGNFVNSKMINPSHNYFETIITDQLQASNLRASLN